jgi:hypothetical protein
MGLPPAWLALLFEHVACGPGGLASAAAAFSQTCKFINSLSGDPAVTYSNLVLEVVISSPDHPAWQWLAKRCGRIAGLSLKLRLEVLGDDDGTEYARHLLGWIQPLQILSGIRGIQLSVECVGDIFDSDHPCIIRCIKQHGHLISHLTVVIHVSEERLKLRDFSEAAAACKSIDLTIWHYPSKLVNLADLEPVAGSLHRLNCTPRIMWRGSIRGVVAFNSMSHLTALHLGNEDFGDEEPWGLLAKLSNLQDLSLDVSARGDPSPLSELRRLTYLHLNSLRGPGPDPPAPFGLSSLQPLSTLQQLEELRLGEHACAATSLQGLAELNMKQLRIKHSSRLRSLEGISPMLTELILIDAQHLTSLVGIGVCTSMEKLSLYRCSVSSLQPLRDLSRLKQLEVSGSCINSVDGINSMSMLQHLSFKECSSLTHLLEVEHLIALESLEVVICAVTSLQPLSQLRAGLRRLSVSCCGRVQEEVLELPHVQPTAQVVVVNSNVKEVVLAGGLRRACSAR